MQLRVNGPATALALAVIAIALGLSRSGTPTLAANQTVSLWPPWEGGAAWSYTQGPHGSAGEALDFQPPDAAGKPCEGFTSSYWVVAAGDGEVTTQPNGLEIDHGNGFRTGYYHIEDKQITSAYVHAGDRLGHPGCCPDGWELAGCFASAPHLHFYTSYNGARQSAIGLNIGGWVVEEDGCMVRDAQLACNGASITSNAPRPDGAPPLLAADIALVVQASEADQPALQQAVAELLAAGRPDDRLAVIQAKEDAPIEQRLEPSSATSTLDRAIVKATATPPASSPQIGQSGLIRGCQELIVEGALSHAAAVLLTDSGPPGIGELAGCLAANDRELLAYDISDGRSFRLQASPGDLPGWVELEPAGSKACGFQRLRRLMSDEAVGDCRIYALAHGETLSLPLRVPPDQASAHFTANVHLLPGQPAPDFIANVAILDPEGESPGPPDADSNLSAGLFDYRVANPEEGEWTLMISGTGQKTFEAEVIIGLSTVAITPPTPAATDTPADTETAPAAESPTPTNAEEPEASPPIGAPGPGESPTPTADAAIATPAEEPTPSPTVPTGLPPSGRPGTSSTAALKPSFG